MSRSISSPIHVEIIAFIIEQRKLAGLTQAVVASRLGRHQSFVATVESGQRRIDIVDLFELAHAIGFNAKAAIESVEQKLDSAHSE